MKEGITMRKSLQNIAVIDLGSNSVRLQITQIINGRFLKVTAQLK